MTTFSISQEDYEALIKLAADGTKRSDGTVDQEKALILDAFLRGIETKNNLKRYLLWIQWQDAGTELQPTTSFPAVWPPELRYRLELVSRPISKEDVLTVLALKAKNPVTVLVTSDPAALVGWIAFEDYFIA